MSKTSNSVVCNFKIDKDIKEKADKLFKDLGMDTNTAINLFINQCIIEQGLPFTPSLKQSSNKKEDLTEHDSFNDLLVDALNK